LLRFLLIEAAHNAIRGDEDLHRFYFHLEARKNASVAIVAVARKLVLRLYRMLRDEIDYHQFRRRGRDARRAREDTCQAASG
jgi:transposase